MLPHDNTVYVPANESSLHMNSNYAKLWLREHTNIEMAQSDHFKAKVVLLGEGAVGKTSIVTRYVKNTFNNQHVMTLQVLCVVRPSLWSTELNGYTR